MARRPSYVYEAPKAELLPPWLSLAVVLLERLGAHDGPQQLEKRLRIDRKTGGHGVVEVVAFLVSFFASGAHGGLRPFWSRMTAWGARRGRPRALTVSMQLAALVGKRSLCSPAALSRALARVSAAAMRPHHAWLLVEVPELLQIFKHPAMLAYDTQGVGWHVFDVDPSATVLRQRELEPASADVPTGHRRADRLAGAGYGGRKRGEVQFLRCLASHAGLGAWVHGHWSRAGGDPRADLAAALDAIVSLMGRLDEPVERCLVRLDGAYGGVPSLTMLMERRLPFVTRAKQHLMHLPEVQQRLTEATWFFVPDAEVSDVRSAAELGVVTLEPSDRLLRDDGGAFEPVTVRAVVSRIPNTGEASHGVVLDGWQYEVFLTTLDPAHWPAAEVIAAYQGRSGCENRYAQEDRELDLDRILCFHPDGQEFAALIGMMVWNLMIAAGFRAKPPPVERPSQTARLASIDPRTCAFPCLEPTPEPVVPSPPPAPTIAPSAVRVEIADALRALPWPDLLLVRPGWTWEPSTATIRCPDGQPLHLVSIGLGERAGGRAAAYFGTRVGTCRECTIRDECLHSKTGRHAKQINVALDADIGARLKDLLRQLARRSTHPRPVQIPPTPRRRTPGPMRGGHHLHDLVAVASGAWALQAATFLAASARAHIRELAGSVQFELSVSGNASIVHASILTARDRRALRHGRRTWTERHERYANPATTRVELKVLADRATGETLLGRRPRPAGPRGVSSEASQ